MKPRAIVLDLGSTRIKLGLFTQKGSMHLLAERSFPEMSGSGLIRETDPTSFRDRVRAMLRKVVDIDQSVPLGISCQRSSFLLWERATGKPLTRLIGWQDRRAQPWCEQHRALEPALWQQTGLPLSPHYAGPKLAYLLSGDRWLAAMARSGKACFGTLETFLAWLWSKGQVFQTDPGMAARTLLFDVKRGDWSEDILTQLAIPRAILPEVRPFSAIEVIATSGHRLRAVVPDQSAAVLPLLDQYPNAAILNAGTGTFLLRRASGVAPSGFLSTYVGEDRLSDGGLFWEAPINAGAELWRQCKPLAHPDQIHADHPFAFAEAHGWAAPFWRSDLGQSCTEPGLEPSLLANLYMEAYAFRVRQVVEGLFPDGPPSHLLIGGGLAKDEAWLAFLTSYLPWPLERLPQSQLSLLGTGWLADQQRLQLSFKTKVIENSRSEFRDARYARWRQHAEDLASQ